MRKHLFKAALAAVLLSFASWGMAEKEKAKAAKSEVDTVPIFDAEPRPDDVAVIIGIEKYRDLPSSDYSSADAVLFREYLLALGYQSRNIFILTDEHATLSDMKMALKRWLPNNAKPEGRVVVYYSGHGSPDPASGKAYLVPYDGNANYLEDTAFPVEKLHDGFSKLKTKEVLVFLDACFSGAGGRSVLAKGARPLVTSVDLKGALAANVAVMSATRGEQISTSSERLGHGIFTYYVLKALREGKKTFSEIYGYARPLVEDEAKGINIDQSPVVSPEAKSLGDRFLLAEFSEVKLEAPGPKADPAAAAVMAAEMERLKREKAAIDAERKRIAEEKAVEEKRMQAARDRMAAEQRQREAEQRQIEAREQELRRKARELEKQRRRSSVENIPPPP